MSKVSPFHSTNPNLADDKKRYHDESTCTEGNNIEKHYWASGTDNRPKCKNCKEISG